jgi:rfaE bifunctional protein nucleotidyltransferase chain/domain
LQHFKDKIFSDIAKLSETIRVIQAEGKKVVFTNGCFDIIHVGHVTYLEEAKNEGDFLVVGINDDSSVSKLKGPNRPINNENARLMVMAALASVDAVILFGEDTPLSLITEIKPDILVKGGDYPVSEIVGADFVLMHGGKVKTLSLIPNYSTTSIEQKLKNQS